MIEVLDLEPGIGVDRRAIRAFVSAFAGIINDYPTTMCAALGLERLGAPQESREELRTVRSAHRDR